MESSIIVSLPIIMSNFLKTVNTELHFCFAHSAPLWSLTVLQGYNCLVSLLPAVTDDTCLFQKLKDDKCIDIFLFWSPGWAVVFLYSVILLMSLKNIYIVSSRIHLVFFKIFENNSFLLWIRQNSGPQVCSWWPAFTCLFAVTVPQKVFIPFELFHILM